MTKPYNYEKPVIDYFFYITVKTHLKSDFIIVLAKQHRGLLKGQIFEQ